MLKYLGAALLALLCLPATAQTVATCASATPGTAFATGQWLPCTPPAIYLVPAQGQIVAKLNSGSGAGWVLSSTLLPTDYVWAETVAVPAGAWVKVSTLAFAPPYTARASISWTAPTANTDGSALTDLAGYKVYSGPSATTLTVLAGVGLVLAYQSNVGVGTTYFSVTAVNSAGTESVRSATVSKTVAAPTAKVPKPPVITP